MHGLSVLHRVRMSPQRIGLACAGVGQPDAEVTWAVFQRVLQHQHARDAGGQVRAWGYG